MPNSLFLSLFGKSALAPVQAHLETCARSTATLIEYFDAAMQENWSEANRLYETIGQLEHDADEIKREVRRSVPRSLMNSISREDLLELVHIQDEIPNAVQDIAGLVLGREMKFPAEMKPKLKEFLAESLNSVERAVDAGNGLIELTKTGFNERGAEGIYSRLQNLHSAEKQSDSLQRELRSILFKIEDTLNPVDVMFIYQILDLIGEISDCAQSAGNRMLYIAYS